MYYELTGRDVILTVSRTPMEMYGSRVWKWMRNSALYETQAAGRPRALHPLAPEPTDARMNYQVRKRVHNPKYSMVEQLGKTRKSCTHLWLVHEENWGPSIKWRTP